MECCLVESNAMQIEATPLGCASKVQNSIRELTHTNKHTHTLIHKHTNKHTQTRSIASGLRHFFIYLHHNWKPVTNSTSCLSLTETIHNLQTHTHKHTHWKSLQCVYLTDTPLINMLIIFSVVKFGEMRNTFHLKVQLIFPILYFHSDLYF